MYINVTRPSMPLYEEYCDEIKELWQSHWLTNMGSKHEQFENDLKHYLSTPNITLFTNGHLALSMVLKALELPESSEVITTPFTFASTTHAIVENGLIPVFCDITSEDFTIDPFKIESLITKKTCAILPVHVYGNMCNVVEIQKIADKYNLKIIYDAAHAFGVSYQGINSANFGDASMFSFHATKVFNTIEGGAVTYSDKSLHRKLNALKNFGITGFEEISYTGGNAKMNEFQAAMGICNLRHFDDEVAKRKTVNERYRANLKNIFGLHLNPIKKNVKSNYAYFPVLFDKERFGAGRDDVLDALARENIFARKYFYPLTNTFSCYEGKYNAEKETPVALKISRQVLTLPSYADLALEDVDRICDTILKCHRNATGN